MAIQPDTQSEIDFYENLLESLENDSDKDSLLTTPSFLSKHNVKGTFETNLTGENPLEIIDDVGHEKSSENLNPFLSIFFKEKHQKKKINWHKNLIGELDDSGIVWYHCPLESSCQYNYKSKWKNNVKGEFINIMKNKQNPKIQTVYVVLFFHYADS